MIEQVTLDVAARLFDEARNWESGRVKYITEDSEIRSLAVSVFHQDHVSHLQAICGEIFYVLACEFRDLPR